MMLHEEAPMAAKTPYDMLTLVERRLLAPGNLTRESLNGALDQLLGNGADYADLYFEATQSESWSLADGRVSAGTFAITQGVGARVVTGDQTGFAHSSAITPKAIATATDSVRAMLLHGGARRRAGAVVSAEPSRPPLYTADNPLEAMAAAEKIRLLRELDRRCREADPRIVQVSAQLDASYSAIMVAGSDGTRVSDLRPLVQVSVFLLARDGSRRALGSAAGGGRISLADLFDERLDTLVRTAVRIALVNLDARPAPSGVMPVVLGPGFPGVLLHEAVGHGLEADAHRKNTSVFGGRLGGSVAASGVTVIDDGTLPEKRGSLNVDDEGVPTRRNVLIENGRLAGLMQDRTSARMLGRDPSGNGRRQSYAHLPMPRMTNTYLAPGAHDPEEIIRSVSRGIYAADFSGGTVDITSGQFNFSAIEAYLIEDGRITAPIQGATLTGLGHEALRRVTMVGSDLDIATGICGKEGQSVPVCVGQPTIRIDDMVVGGTV